MKRDRLHLSPHQVIETDRDWNGRYYVACSKGASMFFRDRKDLLRFLRVPKSIPMRASLDSWLDSLEAADCEPVAAALAPASLTASGSPDGLPPCQQGTEKA